jgi:hypothetical protein
MSLLHKVPSLLKLDSVEVDLLVEEGAGSLRIQLQIFMPTVLYVDWNLFKIL